MKNSKQREVSAACKQVYRRRLRSNQLSRPCIPASDAILLQKSELIGEGTGRSRERQADIGLMNTHFYHPGEAVAKAITEALDPARAPKAVRVLSEEEKREYQKQLLAKRNT